MRVVIFTGGRTRPGQFTRQALASADLVIAADSGARTALDFQVLPSAVVGDLDSLEPAIKDSLAARGTEFIIHSRQKDQTDTELAIAYAVKNGAGRLTVIGGLEGDRLDHVLANVLSMVDAKIPIRFVNGSTAAWITKGPATVMISGAAGDRLSLIPLTARVSGLKTAGLRYPLINETLTMGQARGVANVLTRDSARVTLAKGTLLFIHDAAD